MAAKGALAPTVPVYKGGGGVGGKFEKRSLRKSRATPYDRPHTTLGNSWVSKVFVDPAKKLIEASSRRFFSSVFQKRLPTPSPTLLLPPPVANPELSNGLQDPVLQFKALQSSDVHSHYVATEGSNVSTELLQLFKQNNFTRPEVDHLTKLLESKALNLPETDDARRIESSLSKPTKLYLEDSSVENGRVLEEDIMYPAELAKEYMGSRFSKGSPSMSSFRDQVIIEDVDISNDVPSAPSSMVTSFATKIFNHGNDVEKILTTPRFRARSALHKMASSRMHASPFSKGSGGSIRKLASPTLLKQDEEHGWKEPSRKRSSAVLDDFDSVGEIRRIRRKHGLTLPSGGEKYVFGYVEPFSLTHKRSFMDDWRLRGSKLAGRVEDTNGTSTRFSHLPLKSSEPASRLLQNLENMAPKVNLVEAKLNAARQRTPFKLTEDMLCGKALKSIESIDSLNLLQGTQNGEKLEGNSRDLDFTSQNQNGAEENVLEESHLKLNFTSQKQNGAEESGPEKSHLQLDFTYQKQNGAENGLEKDHLQLDFVYQKQNGAEESGPEESHLQLDTILSVDSEHNLQSSIPSSITSVAQKKHAFMMSVSEDFLDLDEDTHCNGPAAESLLKDSGESKTNVAEGNPTPPGKLILDKPHLELATVSENPRVSVCGDGTTASPTFPLLVTPLQSGSQSPFSLEKAKDVESSSASVLEVSHPWICPEPVRPIRLGDAADQSVQVSESGEREGNFSQEGANANGKSILPGSSNMHNGPVHSIPTTISPSPSLASAGFGNQASADAPSASSNAVSISIATHTSATSSSLTLPALQPSVPLVSTFQFGSSDETSPASKSAASFAEASFTKQEVNKEVIAISTSMPPVGSTSVALASTGSGLLGLVSQPQNAGSGSMFSRQTSEVVSGAATASQSIPFQFGSSASISTGTSGISSLTPATKLFGSVPSFGLSSSTSSLETKSTTFDSGSSPSMFTFGSTVSAISSGANAVSSSSGTVPNVFTFGASSSSTSPAINAFTSSSSTVTPGMFNFGATSSSNMSTSSSASTFSTSFSSSSTIFGSTLQTPMSAPFSAPPSSGFTFGGASSSFTAPNIPVMTFGAPMSSTPPIFTNPSTFTAAGNHDQMNAEDSMAEDPVQSSIIGVPGFGQQPVSSSPAVFPFGSTVQPVASPFQYNGQQSQVPLQNNAFQGSGSLEFNAGGSFSLGSVGGEDKSGRKYVKVNRNRHRKK